MVRLKAKKEEIQKKIAENFNSNMVRLKEDLKKHIAIDFIEFQFQYGSIKSD